MKLLFVVLITMFAVLTNVCTAQYVMAGYGIQPNGGYSFDVDISMRFNQQLNYNFNPKTDINYFITINLGTKGDDKFSDSKNSWDDFYVEQSTTIGRCGLTMLFPSKMLLSGGIEFVGTYRGGVWQGPITHDYYSEGGSVMSFGIYVGTGYMISSHSIL